MVVKLLHVYIYICTLQRDTIQAASHFAHRNQLPVRLQDQMLAHLHLKYRTDSEGVQQQETIDSLPKAIRSSISHFLFYSLVDQVYLFRGVSNDLLFQLVISLQLYIIYILTSPPPPLFPNLQFVKIFGLYILYDLGVRDETRILSSQRRYYSTK